MPETGPLTLEQAAFLERHRVATLATASATGEPHAVPCCFAVVDGRIYTPLDAKPKRVPVERLQRVRDLMVNPAVCLTADDYDEDWTRLAWLQVRGTARLLHGGPERTAAVAALRTRYRQYEAMPLEALPLIRITPLRVVYWAWSGADSGQMIDG